MRTQIICITFFSKKKDHMYYNCICIYMCECFISELIVKHNILVSIFVSNKYFNVNCKHKSESTKNKEEIVSALEILLLISLEIFSNKKKLETKIRKGRNIVCKSTLAFSYSLHKTSIIQEKNLSYNM